MIKSVTLVFHQNGELYISTQALRGTWQTEVAKWERKGYVIKQVEVELPDPPAGVEPFKEWEY